MSSCILFGLWGEGVHGRQGAKGSLACALFSEAKGRGWESRMKTIYRLAVSVAGKVGWGRGCGECGEC